MDYHQKIQCFLQPINNFNGDDGGTSNQKTSTKNAQNGPLMCEGGHQFTNLYQMPNLKKASLAYNDFVDLNNEFFDIKSENSRNQNLCRPKCRQGLDQHGKELPGPISCHFIYIFSLTNKSNKCQIFAYFPWWANGPYSSGLGSCAGVI